jgi:hypothetical protein
MNVAVTDFPKLAVPHDDAGNRIRLSGDGCIMTAYLDPNEIPLKILQVRVQDANKISYIFDDKMKYIGAQDEKSGALFPFEVPQASRFSSAQELNLRFHPDRALAKQKLERALIDILYNTALTRQRNTMTGIEKLVFNQISKKFKLKRYLALDS